MTSFSNIAPETSEKENHCSATIELTVWRMSQTRTVLLSSVFCWVITSWQTPNYLATSQLTIGETPEWSNPSGCPKRNGSWKKREDPKFRSQQICDRGPGVETHLRSHWFVDEYQWDRQEMESVGWSNKRRCPSCIQSGNALLRCSTAQVSAKRYFIAIRSVNKQIGSSTKQYAINRRANQTIGFTNLYIKKQANGSNFHQQFTSLL